MKRVISIFLSIAIFVSISFGFPVEAKAADMDPITATVQGTYEQSSEAQEIIIRIETPGVSEAYCGFGIEGGVTLPQGFKIVSYSTSNTAQPIVAADCNISDENYGTVNYGKLSYFTNDIQDTIAANTYYDVVISVPANAVGVYEITFSDVGVVADEGDVYLESVDEVTATLTISEAPAQVNDYEIYYTLSGSGLADSNDDSYIDYNIGDTVTATVKLKNDTGVDTYLQAYDLYLAYDSNLTYTGTTIKGAEHMNGTTLTHIQAVGENEDGVVLGNVEFKDGDEITLGTITFDIKEDAVYNTEMPITLTTGTGVKTFTNIGVGAADSGNPASYYPVDISEVDGAEVMTTYTVTWKNGETTLETDTAPVGSAPYYNGATPEKVADDQFVYTFAGWATQDGQESGKQVSELDSVTTDVTYYAAFSKTTKAYTVTFDANTGSGTMTAQTFTPGVAQNLFANAFTAPTGYHFAGWNTQADGNGTAYNDKENITISENITLYAQWEINEYTITFVDEDGTELQSGKVAHGTVPTAPADPSKKADVQYTYDFAGWTPTVVEATGDATYTATYTATLNEYTITFVDEDGAELQSDKVAYGTVPTAPADPTKAADNGYTYDFAGWTPAVVAVTGNATYTATYTETPITYTITYINDGEETTATYTIENPVTLLAPEKDGFNFGGWEVTTTTGNWSGTVSGTVTAGKYGNVTLTAVWTDKPLKVEVEGKNGSADVENVDGGGTNANIGDEIKITLDPETGYQYTEDTIDVKYTDKNGDEQITSADKQADGTYTFEVPNDADDTDGNIITVVIPYTGIPYRIVYDKNDAAATGTMENSKAEYGTAIKLTKNAFTKAGYSFAGWATTETGDVAYADEEEVNKLSDDGTAVILYAKWTANENVITVEETLNGEVAAPDKAKTDDTVTVTITPDEGYKLGEIVVKDENQQPVDVTVNDNEGTFTMPAGDVTVTVTFEAIDYTITVAPSDNGTVTTDAENNKAKKDQIVTLTITPNGGYELDTLTVTYKDANGNDQPVTVANNKFTMPASDVIVTATFKVVTYTITLNPDGGTVAPESISYNVTQTFTLPTPVKAKYTFAGWKVTAGANEKWVQGSNFDSVDEDGNTITHSAGYYGNVTLTAQWTRAAIVAVEQYKYADDGQWLLRISDNLNDGNNTYQLEGVEFFYMTAAEDTKKAYLVNDTDSGVFYALVSEEYLKTDENGKVIAELKDDKFDALKGDSGTRNKIDYTTGDINGDGVTNIADANVVYQMIIHTGKYYAGNQLTAEQRLMADMDRAKANNDHRGSLTDVAAIVDIINS